MSSPVGGGNPPVDDGTSATGGAAAAATTDAQPQPKTAAAPGTGHSIQAAGEGGTDGASVAVPAPGSSSAVGGREAEPDDTGMAVVGSSVSGRISWREQPCETCNRPFVTVPAQRLLVAAGRDQDGAVIVHEYVRSKTGDASKRKLPANTLFRDLRDARLTENGWVVYGMSEVLDRRPRDDELMIAIADLKAGRLRTAARLEPAPADDEGGRGREGE